MTEYPRQAAPERKRQNPGLGLKWPLLILALLLACGALWLYNTLSEVGLTALLPGQHAASQTTVRLKDQPVYHVKKKLDLLGMKVVRIVSSQQPQEFLVLDGVSAKLVDKVFAKQPDMGWTNLMANQFLKLREAGEGDAAPVSVEIQALKTTSAGTIVQGNRNLPYWQVEIRFKLSNEMDSRYYQAGVIRNANDQRVPTQSGEQPDTLVVGYAQKEAFQKPLMADLISNLRFEKN